LGFRLEILFDECVEGGGRKRQILAFEEGPDLLAEQEAAVLSGRQRK
jgi:hypothetical protein